jgi:hypothetical protein
MVWGASPAGSGVIRARVRVETDAPGGVRAFTAVVPASGVVEAVGPAVLAQTPGPVFTARYAGGEQLTASADDAAVALRWVWTEGAVEVIVVGTRADQATAVRELGDGPAAARPAAAAGRSRRAPRRPGCRRAVTPRRLRAVAFDRQPASPMHAHGCASHAPSADSPLGTHPYPDSGVPSGAVIAHFGIPLS